MHEINSYKYRTRIIMANVLRYMSTVLSVIFVILPSFCERFQNGSLDLPRYNIFKTLIFVFQICSNFAKTLRELSDTEVTELNSHL